MLVYNETETNQKEKNMILRSLIQDIISEAQEIFCSHLGSYPEIDHEAIAAKAAMDYLRECLQMPGLFAYEEEYIANILDIYSVLL